MYKKVVNAPHRLEAPRVSDVYSVSGCISQDFCEWISHWQHNGFWLFNSLGIIEEIAAIEKIDLSSMTLFYYRMYPFQWDNDTQSWLAVEPDSAFETAVSVPANSARRMGFDVVTYSAQNAAECSPLSCNHFANTIPVNRHCLFDRFEDAKVAIEAGIFVDGEPGPHRIVEVSLCDPQQR